MRRLRSFGPFWWSFIVGDDWLVAAGIASALGATALSEAWWLLPLAVAVVLAGSLVRAMRSTDVR